MLLKNSKILILSISSWNSKVGADTWPTLMSGLNPDNIACISLRDEIPDSHACNNYFSISENRIIKSIFNRKIKTGKRVELNFNSSDESDLVAHNLRYKKMSRKRGFLGFFAREVVWKLGKWKTKELEEFIRSFNPDIILYPMEGYIHFNRICRYAKKITGAKSIGYFWDDNFTFKQTIKLGSKLFRVFQRSSLKKLVKKTDAFWAISNMTKKEADEFFNINCTVVTKPLKKETVYTDWQVSAPVKILYTGNLQIGRDRSLVKVVNALKEINKDKILFQVDAYTKTQLSDEINSQLDCEFCKVHEPIPQSEVLKLQEQADILLFLEDVDGADAKTARLSFSTKITDYLSSGKCIFAVGCMNTAPMQYFLENQSAIIATTNQEMLEVFSEIVKDKQILKEYAKNACDCGLKYHKKENVLQIVHNSIEQLL